MAKGFKTGGRTVGTLNKRTQAMLEEIASTGETPLQHMLRGNARSGGNTGAQGRDGSGSGALHPPTPGAA